MYNNLVKIAVSIKQLEANINRARAQGKIVDAASAKAGEHYADATKFINSLSDSELRNVHAKYPGLLSTASLNPTGVMQTSAALPSMAKGLKSSSVLNRQNFEDMSSNLSIEYKPSLNPLKLLGNTSKLYLNSLGSRLAGKYTNMFPKDSSEPGSKAFDIVKNPGLLTQARLAVNKDASNKADEHANKIKKLIVNQKGRAYLDPVKDQKIKPEFYDVLKGQDDLDVNTLIANHELNELNSKKFRHGGNFIQGKTHGHAGLQGLHDVTMVNTMGNESPRAQEFVRDMRRKEVSDMLRNSPGLSPVLKNMSGGQAGRDMRIIGNSVERMNENTAHNRKILGKVPSHLHSHPMVQARLKPDDFDAIRDIVTKEHDKGGRLNRHMLKHVGNVLDRDYKKNVNMHSTVAPGNLIDDPMGRVRLRSLKGLAKKLNTNKTKKSGFLEKILENKYKDLG